MAIAIHISMATRGRLNVKIIIMSNTGASHLYCFHISFTKVENMYSYLLRLNGLCITWWRHLMETFSALLAICTGNSPGTGEYPTQRPGTRSFHVFFDLHLNKRLSKQWWGWWSETQSCPLWRQCNDVIYFRHFKNMALCILHPFLPRIDLQTWIVVRKT